MALQAVVSAANWVAGGLRAMERAAARAARDIWSEAYAALTISITIAREMTRTVIPSADSIATEPHCPRRNRRVALRRHVERGSRRRGPRDGMHVTPSHPDRMCEFQRSLHLGNSGLSDNVCIIVPSRGLTMV